MELGKKIRQLRFKAEMTQEQLAERLGIGAQSVSKWENSVAMPDITLLPLIAEIFGVSIDDLFDLTTEQRLNRIENRLDTEEDVPPDVFREYEDFLQAELSDEEHAVRATELMAFLYWTRMNAAAAKTAHFAKEAIRMSPAKKYCQWMYQKATGHAVWDWNIANNTSAIEFYRGIVEEEPEVRLPYMYLLDNLIADHRADEALVYLERMSRLKDADPVMVGVYRANIALARFDEKAADGIIGKLLRQYPENSDCLFEAAQYYAKKSDYDRAIGLYEEAFRKDQQRPRFQDALQAIADIYRIKGDPAKAADTYDRIITLLAEEWGIPDDEAAMKEAVSRRDGLRAKAQQ